MFTVGSGKMKVASQGVDIAELGPGDIFGEVALLMKRPRSSTISCISPACKVLEMKGEDFMALVDSTPDFEASLRDLSRRREFKKALKKAKGDNGTSLKDLFEKIDLDGDGKLSALEVKQVLRSFDASFPDEEANALVQSMDVDGSGFVSWDEFKRVVGLEVWVGELHKES
jgi:CRP-like cAMP-binding protein